jgi:phosphatidate cytidylyltransferase
LATAALVGLGCSLVWPQALSTLTWPKALLFGIVIGGVGQAGDLLESLMKRDAQVKDSGDIIPGFGGLLDVIDSPLLAAPAAYLLFSLF